MTKLIGSHAISEIPTKHRIEDTRLGMVWITLYSLLPAGWIIFSWRKFILPGGILDFHENKCCNREWTWLQKNM